MKSFLKCQLDFKATKIVYPFLAYVLLSSSSDLDLKVNMKIKIITEPQNTSIPLIKVHYGLHQQGARTRSPEGPAAWDVPAAFQ